MNYVEIGVLLADEVRFSFSGLYRLGGDLVDCVANVVKCVDGLLAWQGKMCERLHFVPMTTGCRFTLCDVVIGVDFHWERKQNQMFEGELLLFVEDGKVRAVNVLPVENYLKSVISSEMSASASLEFLKAHTVISRSWLYAQLMRKNETTSARLGFETENEVSRWYARENHTTFDLCADDHCQRYQGVPIKDNKKVEEAEHSTENEVLTFNGKVCDARFSKCCGGVTERFSSCWEDADFEYLQSFRDCEDVVTFPDLKLEDNARQWIEDSPPSLCNTSDKNVLSQIMNNYDCETTDFYRWKITYTQDELSQIVALRSGIDFGSILDLVPVERAASGRLVRLRVVGSKRTMVVGKELEIRRWLSPSHLYSSAFVVDKEVGVDNSLLFVLKGAGWGHGVGLCQIGAAMMGEKGYDYRAILNHYYPGAVIEDVNSVYG